MDSMETLKKPLSPFDKFLFGGLGCGFIIICILGGWIFYIMRNLPVPRSSPTQTAIANVSTELPTQSFDISTATSLPTIPPTLDSAFATLVPSPIPNVFDGTPPSGKIAFTCYIKQIDQICI